MTAPKVFLDSNILLYLMDSDLENDCDVLYSEDLAEGQLIEKKLKIVNPFKLT